MRTIRHENVALLTMAAVFSVVATVVLSGFLEPSQPPAVAAVEIGDPREDESGAREHADRRDGAERRRGGRGAAASSRRGDGSSPVRPDAAGQAAPAPSRETRPASPRETSPPPSQQRSAAPRPEPAPLLPIAPAEQDDDAGEPAEADDVETD